jgi:hypothetical protein
MGMLPALGQERGQAARAQAQQDQIDGERRPLEGGGVVSGEEFGLGHGVNYAQLEHN